MLGKLDELKVLTGDVANAEVALRGNTVFWTDRSKMELGKRGGVLLYNRDTVVT